MDWIKEFQNPPSKYRIKPFWFWNGDMKKEEIEKQIQEMSDKGLGGAFICARQGLEIPYLSEKWFDYVEYASEKARENGLELWLYDENPYPSGMAGGEVLLRHPGEEHMQLVHRTWYLENGGYFEEKIGWAEILSAAAYPVREGKTCYADQVVITDCIGNLQMEEIFQRTGLTSYNNKRFFTSQPEHVISCILPEGRWKVEIFMQEPLGEFKYYGKFFDPCSKTAVKEFLSLTHERYKKRFQGQFGKTIRGIFSDEVGLLSPVPWSKYLPDYFSQKKGCDLTAVLPAVYDNQYPNAYAIRYALYDMVHQLFVESYHKQIAEWCQENQLAYLTEVPSMRMTTQRFSTIVGGDTAHEKLGKPLEWIYDEYIHHYRSNAKAVSSMTRQLGHSYAMIESFHSIGWSMTIQDAKWMFDRLAASGINFYNVHAFYYTAEALMKHDAPPSQFLQNPYWKNYRLLADYVGRLGAWVTNTEADIHVAVLDPVATLWCHLANPFTGFNYAGEDEEEKKQCDYYRESWTSVCKQLLFEQIDYEHLDAEMLKEAEISEGEIKIGRAAYRLLVLPPMKCIEKDAYLKIQEFLRTGGAVCFTGECPKILIGETQTFSAEETEEWMAETNCYLAGKNPEDWWEWCRIYADLSFDIRPDEKSKKEIVTSIREKDGSYYLLLANQGGNHVPIGIRQRKGNNEKIYELLLEDGSIMACSESMQSGFPYRNIRLKPYESKLLCYANESLECVEKQQKKDRYVLETKGKMPVRIYGGNVYRIADFEMSKNRKDWYPTAPATFVEQCAGHPILNPEDYRFSDGFGLTRKVAIGYPFTIWYRSSFWIEEKPEQMKLMLDKGTISPGGTIWVNHHELKEESFVNQFVYDQNNRMCDIEPFLQSGENEILVEIEIKGDADGLRDPICLYGDFGVDFTAEGKSRIRKMPEKAALDLDYIKGFPYYSGTFRFETTTEMEPEHEEFELCLDIGEACHECLEIKVNGQTLGTRAFSPYVWSGNCSMLRNGTNQIEIELTNTLAPMLDGGWFNYEEHKMEYLEKEEL